MEDKDALINYLVEFHATRDFFECHEIMEEHWKTTEKDAYERLWVALIQVAVGQYHDRRRNLTGAKRMYESAYIKLRDYITVMTSIDLVNLCEQLENRLQALDKPFYDFNFNITDKHLYEACIQLAKSRQLVWGISSGEIDEDIINRHKTRDRTSVIADRLTSLEVNRQLRLRKNELNE